MRCFLATILLISGVSFCLAQNYTIACHAFPKTTKSYIRKLWNGYEISLGPARNAQGDGDECTAAIYNAVGKVVYRTTGFGVTFLPDDTGKDIDGDGKPDVVFMTHTGGGAHCCFVYNVISLFPKPHKLFDIGDGGDVSFKKDKSDKIAIWKTVSGTHDLTSEARTPGAEQVFQVQAGALVDATPEFCGEIFSPGYPDYDNWVHVLIPENIKKFQTTKPEDDPQFDYEEVVSALLSRAQQQVLCHEYDQALADLNLWPEESRDKMKVSFAKSIKDYSPEFAARLIKDVESKNLPTSPPAPSSPPH